MAEEEKDKNFKALAESRLFENLNREALEAIAAIALEVTLPPDTVFARMGDTGGSGCLIVSGGVKIFRPGKDGAEIEITRLGPGESFGEANLLAEEPIPTSVKTLEESRLIVIQREPFGPIMQKYPEVSAAIGKAVSHWLDRASTNIERRINPQAASLRWIDFIPIIGISLVCALAFNASNPKGIPIIPKSFARESLSYISPSAAYDKYKQGKILVIDAMPSIFYDQEHIDKALSLPLDIFDFMYDIDLAKIDKDKEIIVYGRSISKHYDEEVANKLVLRGFKDVKILKGGRAGWEKNHYPVVP